MAEVTQALRRRANPLFVPTDRPTSFESLKSLIDGLDSRYNDQIIKENLAVVASVAHPQRILSLLDEISADKAVCVEIARRSYRHTNHFDKIVLIDSGQSQKYRLTLHLWMPPYSAVEVQDEQIHMHRFSFWSNVLVGSLQAQNYIRSDDGAAFEEYRYVPEKRAETTIGNFYEHLGTARLQELAPSKMVAGTSYHLFYERIHRIMLPSTDLTCTMVLRGPRQRNHSSVFSNSRKYEPINHLMFSAHDVAHRLMKLKVAIAATRTEQMLIDQN